MTAPPRFRAVVRGRVQGVGFRASVREQARRLGLRGWAKNLMDGTVEVVAEGEAAAIQGFLEYLRQGPPGARVQGLDLDLEWTPTASAAIDPGTFEVR
jgi:acylphosphatase